MKFYLIAFLLAYFQSSVLIAIFHNMLITPNPLLVYLFLNIFRENGGWLLRTITAGFFLDLFQDSLGLNLSGYIFFATLFSLMRSRVEIPNRLSLLFAYLPLSLMEKLWVIFLFRIRYYADLTLWLLPFSLFLETLFLYLISGRYFRKGS